MSDELPRDAEEALRRFGPGSGDVPELARVRDGALRSIRRRRVARRAAGTVAVAAIAALVAWTASNGELPWGPSAATTAVASVTAAEGVSIAGEPVAAGSEIPAGPVSVAANGELELSLGDAVANVEGPAELVVGERRLAISEGAGRVRGRLAVEGCGCEATVDGEARVEAFQSYLSVVIVAGSVHVESPEVYCRVIELDALAGETEREPRAEAGTAAGEDEALEGAEEPIVEHAALEAAEEPAVRRPRARRPRATRCDLGAQAEAYREAMALRGRDDALLVRRLREVRREWPRCALSHEVDVALIEALLRAGDEGTARTEAARFLRRYPRSARRDAIEAIAAQ